MNWMTFKDGTRIEIEEGATFDHIEHIASNEATALFVCEKCTAENTSRIVFSQPDEQGAEIVTGDYDNLVLNGAPTRQTNEDGLSVTVVISFREKSELEARVEALEESQGVQDEAIDDLGGAVSEIMEG